MISEKFMSVVVYDLETRSEIQTSQPLPGKNDRRDKPIVKDDGSIGLSFGPKAPADKEANWIQTFPGMGWFSLLRLYTIDTSSPADRTEALTTATALSAAGGI